MNERERERKKPKQTIVYKESETCAREQTPQKKGEGLQEEQIPTPLCAWLWYTVSLIC